MKTPLMTFLALGLIVGCTTDSPTEADFGNSVRQVISAQAAYPERVANPPTELPTHTMAPRLNNALEVYRTHVGDPKAIDRNIIVGANQGTEE